MGRKRKREESPPLERTPVKHAKQSEPAPVAPEPPSKRRRSVDPSQHFQEVYETIRHWKDGYGRLLCEHLIRVPKRRNVPEYYEKVQNPIDLLKIQQRLKTDEYTSLESFTSDMQLLLSNAQIFYPVDSQEYQASAALHDILWSTFQRLFPGTSAPAGQKWKTNVSSAASEVPKVVQTRSSASSSAKVSTTPSRADIKAAATGTPPAKQSTPSAKQSTPSAKQSTPSTKQSTPAPVAVPKKDQLASLSSSASLLDICQAVMDELMSLEDRGHSVCDMFMKLPAQSQYPDYYRVITEPIDVKMILQNIKAQRYSDFNDFRLDLTIMVKNAQHFNEPSSQVYKDATLIDKSVDLMVKKLLVSHASVMQPRPSLKVTLRPTPPTPTKSVAAAVATSTPQTVVPSSTADSSNASLVLREDELYSSSDESQFEVASSAAESKSDVWQRVSPHRRHFVTFYLAISQASSATGRELCKDFMRLPSSRNHPEYYERIKNPMSMLRIKRRLWMNRYRHLSDIQADMELTFQNALLSFPEGSRQCKDAVKLLDLVQKKAKELEGGLKVTIRRSGSGAHTAAASPPSSYQSSVPITPGTSTVATPASSASTPVTAIVAARKTTPVVTAAVTTATPQGVATQAALKPPPVTPITVQAALQTALQKAVTPAGTPSGNLTHDLNVISEAITKQKDISGQQVSSLLFIVPSAEDCPDYHKFVTKHMDLKTIQTRMMQDKYVSVTEACLDYDMLFKNTKAYFGDGSYMHNVATQLESALWRAVPDQKPLVAAASAVSFKDAPAAATLKRTLEPLSSHKPADHVLRLGDMFQCSKSVRAGFSLYLMDGKYYMSASQLAKYSSVASPIDIFTRYPFLTRLVVTDPQERTLLVTQGLKKCDGYVIVLIPSQVEGIVTAIAASGDKKPGGCVAATVQRPFPATTAQASIGNTSSTLSSSRREVPSAVQSNSQVFLHRKPGRPLGTNKMPSASVAELDIECQRSLLDAVSEHTDVSGRLLVTPFMDLPSATEYANYYTIIKKPIDLKTIRSKMESFKYADMDELYQDLMLMCDNATKYNERGSQIYKDAVSVQNFMIRKKSVLKDRAGKSRGSTYGAYPDVPLLVRQLLAKLFQAVLNFEDENDRCLSVQLFQASVAKDSTDGKVSLKRANIETIKRDMNEGEYQRLDKLQSDLFHVFENVRQQHAVGGQEWTDSVKLQQFFIEKRDELCGQGQILDSPAFSFGLPNLEARLAKVTAERAATKTSSFSIETQSSQQHSGASQIDSTGATSQGDGGELAGGEVRMDVTGEEATASDSKMDIGSEAVDEKDEHLDADRINPAAPKATVTVGTEKYSCGQFVYVKPRDAAMDNHIVVIERWEESGEKVEFFGNYFYRPPETFHVATRKFLEREVFKSDYHAPFSSVDIVGRCCVMFVREYFKMTPENLSAEDVFVCESRYLTKAKSFKKIKMWPFTAEPFKLRHRTVPLTARRVESVFAQHASSTSSAAKMAAEADSVISSVTSGSSTMCARVAMDNVDDNPYTVSEHVNVRKGDSKDTKEDGCVYYEQYCFESGTFKLGDNVYLRSDQADPYVARIDRIWTDKDGDPYFHGPWFVRPSEVDHPASRMFCKQELLMSSIHDTNPMRSIQGRCAILDMQTYVKGRITEISETDVFVCESRYNEADKLIRRLKGLKVFQLSSRTVSDEWYYFGEEIAPLKVPSPHLGAETDGAASSSAPVPTSGLKTLTGVVQRTSPAASSGARNTAAASASSAPRLAAAGSKITVKQSTGSVAAYLLFAGETSASLRLSRPNMSSDDIVKTVGKAWHQLTDEQRNLYDKKASSLSHSSVFAAPQPTITVYECHWVGCTHQYESEKDLVAHMLNTNYGGHLHNTAVVAGEYPCKWRPCQRFKRHVPFQSHYKLSKHVRENHQYHAARRISVAQLSSNYFPESVPADESVNLTCSVATVSSSVSQSPSTGSLSHVTTTTAASDGSAPAVSVAAASTATAAATASAGTPASPAPATLSSTAAVPKAAAVTPVVSIADDEERSIAVHSALYNSYLARVERDCPTLSDWSDVTNTDDTTVPITQLPVAWLPSNISGQLISQPQQQQKQVVVKAMLDLRKLLLRDAASLGGWEA